MGLIRDIAGKKICVGGGTAANTGKLGCLTLFGAPAHFIAIPKGTQIAPSQEFDAAYLKELALQNKLTAIIGASDFEDISSEDGYYSNTRGAKRLNLKGLPEYKLMFEEGHAFYKEMSKMESYKNFDYIIGDEDGNWMVATKSNGNYQGFTSGHTTPELTQRAVVAGDPEMKSLVVQFIDRLQWDLNYDIIHAEDVDFTPEEVPSINGITIAMDAIPANAEVNIDVTVTLSADKSSTVEGLVAADFLVTINGVAAIPSALSETTGGKYALTVPAMTTADTVLISAWNATHSTLIADSNDVLYRNSVTTSAVVV